MSFIQIWGYSLKEIIQMIKMVFDIIRAMLGY